jgi:hypothetical protein
MRFNGLNRPGPVNYFAIRDPSSVRVVPVRTPPLPGGFRHVDLRFQIGRNGSREAVVIVPRNGHSGGAPLDQAVPAAAGFLVSVGLPIAREQEFFEKMVLHNRDRHWNDVYTQLGEDCHHGK